MPLTNLQKKIAILLSKNRTPDSYLAGGAALQLKPESKRYSADLDYFHDSVERVAKAFEGDKVSLEDNNYLVKIDLTQPGYIRSIISYAGESTKVEWAHDSAWRFLPTVKDPLAGYTLHPIDLAINKLLALVGRDEPRDFLDVLQVHRDILPLGALCWGAAGKDPGFTPLMIIDLLRRRGKYHPEDFNRLHLVEPVDLVKIKIEWLDMLQAAEQFVRSRPAKQMGCLYYSNLTNSFVQPANTDEPHIIPHFGRPGGILPRIIEKTKPD